MLRDRVIPCLLLRGSGFVKTRRFKKARYIGDAINALRIFNDKGADELIVVDIDASSAGYAPRMDMIRQLTDELFMPLTYGGGISTLEQVDEIIKAGVEKVAINAVLAGCRPEWFRLRRVGLRTTRRSVRGRCCGCGKKPSRPPSCGLS